MAQRKRPPSRGTSPRGTSPQGRPAPARPTKAQPKPFLTEGGSPFRHAVERRSAVVLVFLHRLPRAVPGLVVLGLVAAGLIAPPVASGVALLVVSLLLAWLVFLSWPSVPAVGRAVRLVVIAIMVAYAASRFTA